MGYWVVKLPSCLASVPHFPFYSFPPSFLRRTTLSLLLGVYGRATLGWADWGIWRTWSIHLHHQNCWVMGFVPAVLCSSVSEIMLGKKDSKNSLQASILEVIICTLWQFFAPPHCHLPLSSLFSKLIICRHVIIFFSWTGKVNGIFTGVMLAGWGNTLTILIWMNMSRSAILGTIMRWT